MLSYQCTGWTIVSGNADIRRISSAVLGSRNAGPVPRHGHVGDRAAVDRKWETGEYYVSYDGQVYDMAMNRPHGAFLISRRASIKAASQMIDGPSPHFHPFFSVTGGVLAGMANQEQQLLR